MANEYDNYIDRSGATALMPEEVSRDILQSIGDGSFVTRLARRLPNMARAQRRMPILSVLPKAYFVGEKGRTPQTFGALKQTTEMAWANKYINAEELAVIVPIPQTVLDDADYDIWGELKPQILESIGAEIDTAILYGESNVSVPVAWPDGILYQMPTHHTIKVGEVGDLYDDIFGEGGVFAAVEEDGYLVNGVIAALSMRAKLRSLREKNWNGTTMVATGEPLFKSDLQGGTNYSLDGNPLQFPTNGAFDATKSLLISGDFNQLVWAVRTDITYKLLTEGVITDENNAIVHNLAQEDMVALRVTFRLGWALPNPLNRVQTDSTKRFPFAAYTPLSV